VFDEIVEAAGAESALWAAALRPRGEQEREAAFSRLGPDLHALGLETIYEGYLVHYGRSRLFAPADRDTALLLGDYLYAHGLVRIAETGDVAAVAALAELISRCARLRAESQDGDGDEWVATASSLSGDASAGVGGEAVEAALATHARLVG
jgi:hypothetical protein